MHPTGLALERVYEHPPKHSGRERGQRVCLDVRIVELAAHPIRDSENPCAFSADEVVADEWNPAEHRIEGVGGKEVAAKVDGAVRSINTAVDGDADGSDRSRVTHVQPTARPGKGNLCSRDQDPFAAEKAGDAVERADVEDLRENRRLRHAEVRQVDPAVDASLLTTIIDRRDERELAALSPLENT